MRPTLPRILLPTLPLLLFACAPQPDAIPFEESEGAVSPALSEEAPGVAVLGVELGRTRHAEALAWLQAHSLSCEVGPSSARTSFRYDCAGTLPLALLGDADPRVRGEAVLRRLLLARPDSGPLHHLSTIRSHPSGASAAADYAHAVAQISERLGAPDRHQPADPEAMSGPVVRYASTWRTPAVEVVLSVLRVGDGELTVQERWTVPDAEAQAERAEGRAPNPHLLRED